MALKTSAAAWAAYTDAVNADTPNVSPSNKTLAISAVLFVLAIKWVYYNRYRKTM